MKYCFGIDIGGTATKMGLFNENGALITKWEIPTRTQNCGEHILRDIADALHEQMLVHSLSPADITSIGVGVPAAVDENGIVESTTNLGWNYKEVTRELEKLTGFLVYVENDANLAALGEMWKGAGIGCKNMIMITLGTGVGGGIIINNQIIGGFRGGAGEIGEILVDYDADSNGNLIPRNLEYYVSATGIARMAAKAMKSNMPITAKNVFDAAKLGDKSALKVLDRFGFYLGQAIFNLSVTLAPELVVIGGGVSKAGNILLEFVEKYCHIHNFKLTLAELGNDAGIYGAANLALKDHGL